MEKSQLESLAKLGKYGPYEKEFIKKDGSTVPVRLTGFIIQKENKPFIWSIIEDITVEKQFKDEIESRRILFESIVENIPSAIYIKDAAHNFKFVLWNKACEDMFEYDREAVLGKSDHDIWPTDYANNYLTDDRNIVAGKKMVDIKEEHAKSATGREIIVHSRKLPLFVPEGSFHSSELLLCISEDITDLKNLEWELNRSIQLRDEFILIASHQLKTPLSSLFLQLELLQRALKESIPQIEKSLSYSSNAILSCRRLKILINELLDITQIKAKNIMFNKMIVSLEDIVNKVISLMAEDIKLSGSSISVYADKPVEVLGDPNRLEQIIQNLISNAIKYGDEKPIEVSIGILGKTNNKRAYLKVKDHGLGIPEAYQESIFECFERVIPRNPVSGLGLGLYIVNQLVEAHEGTIRVESTPGKGSTFIVELPIE